ncbi:Type I site-specific deoxyribonuclease [Thermobacillus xylanilyticus]|uniref:Type I site-specific deoxyribonuclease n=1 Tax=Thermobacillus xylanilyticus TaxID=76633 RepID=A0ABN7S2Z2_THEXY|nr:type I restriction endonuclease [Thermobacillus xylanilyticus]CAG5089479.1 Type I site-specific deoxyribonuclease [Thermobacillus xylanilyticus]
MSPLHTERALEDAIETHLIGHGGYEKGDPAKYDRELALFPKTVIRFIKSSQPDEWNRLVGYFGHDTEKEVIKRLVQVLQRDGMLKVLRKGFDLYNVPIRMAYFKPASGLNPDAVEKYGKNILTVTRQVHYSTRNENSLDIVLAVNGLPVATVELKNPFTGQTVEDAKRQYKVDRDPNELLFQFKKRALVHFAVDPDEVYMTTRLDGSSTRFLPFNRGYNNGAGNPPDEKTGIRTSYLWRDIWQRDSWLDILHRFLHLQVEEKVVNGQRKRKESMIFPRYHQLDAVRKIEADVLLNGPGHNYLIQHSAGSGKTNSIAWLAHRLSSLHDQDDKPIFHAVIVITDRVVLDRQLQDTIYQFEHVQGVVRPIKESSRQLAQALNSGARIIITTLQKFGYILDQVGNLSGKNFALIVDEAHSSQSGKAADAVKQVLAAPTLEEAEKLQAQLDAAADDAEEEILKELAKRGPQRNLSHFAFTATPKHKTIEMFGRKDENGKYQPFHLYSMRQAIEEGFILDVLRNYVTYKTYYKLAKAIEDDPLVDERAAKRSIARFVSLHPYNLSQKTEVMIEHFRRVTRHKIGGRAKAMVVTSSRLHALRYKQAFDAYIREKGYNDIQTLVAFSGTVIDDGQEFTEPKINGFGEKELPEKFDTDDYQVLIVADKYQTGFDQPLLHTMFVDKKLSGIQAVQTLSRLNRTYPGKEDTFILDFVNEPEDIKKAFLPYYEKTELEHETDLNLLSDLKNKLDDFQIYWQSEIDAFCRVFFRPKERQKKSDIGRLHQYVDPAVDRFRAKSREEQEEFRSTLAAYIRAYAFITQIAPFQSVPLHKLYAYGQLLLRKLPTRGVKQINLDDDVALEYYRLQETSNGNISLMGEEPVKLKGMTDTGTGILREEKQVYLSSIIDVLNKRFGTEFKEADKLFFDQIEQDIMDDAQIVQSARNNTIDNFKFVFDEVFLEKVISRMGQNDRMFAMIMDDQDFQQAVKAWILKSVYEKINENRPA